MSELNDVFDESEVDETEAEEVEATETEETEDTGEEKAETEETETEEVEETEEPEPASTEPKMVPLAAVQDERRKRQEIEKRLQEVESKLPKVSDEPDMYEDPDGYKQWVQDQARAELAAEQSKVLEVRINDSREQMLEERDDFLVKENAFLVLVQSSPELTQEMLNSANPAKFAYEKGEEFLNSLMTPAGIPKESKPGIPVSLAKASAKGANTVEIEEDDDDLKSMFADQKY